MPFVDKWYEWECMRCGCGAFYKVVPASCAACGHPSMFNTQRYFSPYERAHGEAELPAVIMSRPSRRR